MCDFRERDGRKEGHNEAKRGRQVKSRENRVRKVLTLICAFKTKITENKNTEELPSKAHFLQEWQFKDNA